VEGFYKKNLLLSDNDICFKAASDNFVESEALCSETNVRLAYYMKHRGRLDPTLSMQIAKMERFIVNVLGDHTRFLSALPHLVKVTPGATSYSARKDSLPQLKMKTKLFCTRRARPYLSVIYRYFGFDEPEFKLTPSNRVELVPKNWKTHRTIACEPEGNLPLQLAFDTYAKGRLRRFGIDLSNQSKNRIRSKQGSIHNNFCTVDFASASDTISYNAVSWLFPVDWYKFLADVRSPFYRGVFGDGTYSKFSSMGNGSTFTIETLLFAAACHAVGSHDFLVYGDDVIIEPDFYEAFVNLTRFLGFRINESKTFTDGPFRESCGLDSFNGVDVTPVFVRNIDKRKASLCHLTNSLLTICFPEGELAAFLRKLVIEEKLPLVPFQENTLSGVFIDPNEARSLGILRSLRYKGNHTYIERFRAYVPVASVRPFVDERGYYLWFLRKNSQVLFSQPWDSASVFRDMTSETSSALVFDHTYVRKRVCWHSPAEASPSHLSWWLDFLHSR
jgi:hypothetical protein